MSNFITNYELAVSLRLQGYGLEYCVITLTHTIDHIQCNLRDLTCISYDKFKHICTCKAIIYICPMFNIIQFIEK
jgi:hypothetical protein